MMPVVLDLFAKFADQEKLCQQLHEEFHKLLMQHSEILLKNQTLEPGSRQAIHDLLDQILDARAAQSDITVRIRGFLGDIIG